MTTDIIKFTLRCICLVLFAFAIVSAPASAQTHDDKTLSPYFVVKGDPDVDHLPLKDTRVEIAVSGVIADVKVVQTYRNEGSRPSMRLTFFRPPRAQPFTRCGCALATRSSSQKSKNARRRSKSLRRPRRKGKAHRCWSKTGRMCFR